MIKKKKIYDKTFIFYGKTFDFIFDVVIIEPIMIQKHRVTYFYVGYGHAFDWFEWSQTFWILKFAQKPAGP